MFFLLAAEVLMGLCLLLMFALMLCGAIYAQKRRRYVLCVMFAFDTLMVIAMSVMISMIPYIKTWLLLVGMVIGAFLTEHVLMWIEKLTEKFAANDGQRPQK